MKSICVNKNILRVLVIFLFALFVYLPNIDADNELELKLIQIGKIVEPGGEATYQFEVTNFQGERDILRLNYDIYAVFPFSEVIKSIKVVPTQLKLEPLKTGTFNVSIEILDTSRTDITIETSFEVVSLITPTIKEEKGVQTRVVSPKEVITITPSFPEKIFPGEDYDFVFTIKNTANNELRGIEVIVTSDYPQLQKNMLFDFKPLESIEEKVTLRTTADVKPGDYIINLKAYEGSKTRGSFSSVFTIFENEEVTEDIVRTEEFLEQTATITKKNKGNVVSFQKIEVKLSTFESLFTSFKPEPEFVDGKYVWEFSLQPNEEFSVSFTTNYSSILYGLIIIIIATVMRILSFPFKIK